MTPAATETADMRRLTRAPWFRTATRPLRAARQAARQVQASIRGGCAVLMYHQIAEGDPDPWNTSVSPAHFAEHLEVLADSGRPVLHFGELADALRAGRLPSKAVAITFDDGYADNLSAAVPLLEKAGLPATFFVTECAIDRPREMWWDELERVLLRTEPLPDRLELDIAGERVAMAIDGPPTSAKGWQAGVDPPADGRQAALQQLSALLTPLPAADQDAAADALAAWAGLEPRPRPSHRMLTSAELATMAASPVVEIGSHTMTHASLPVARDLTWELTESRARLRDRTGAAVETFAYPSGHHDDRVVAATRDAGYTAAATCVRRPVRGSDEPLRMGRIMVEEWSGEEFDRQLRGFG